MSKHSKDMKKYYPFMILGGVAVVALTIFGLNQGDGLQGYLKLNTSKSVKVNPTSLKLAATDIIKKPVSPVPPALPPATPSPATVKDLTAPLPFQETIPPPLDSDLVTRGDLANIMYHKVVDFDTVTGIPQTKFVSMDYTDLPCTKDLGNSKYLNEICNIAAMGVISPYKDNTGTFTGYFGPSDPVTRALAAKSFVRALRTQPAVFDNSITCYSDVPTTGWFFEYVCSLSQAKVLDVELNETAPFFPGENLTYGALNTWISNAKTANLIK